MMSTRLRSTIPFLALILAHTVSAISVSLYPVHPHCGLINGSINANVSGGTAPYTYLWNNNETTEDIDSLPPGTYTITVTDALNATATANITLANVQALITPPIDQLGGTDCFGPNCEAHALIQLSNLGGTPPYSFQPPPNTQSATTADWTLCGLINPGGPSLPFTMMDANGCAGGASFWLYMPAGVGEAVPAVTTLPSCNGGANGTAMLHYWYADAQSAILTVLDANSQPVFTAGIPINITGSIITVPNLLPGNYTVSYTVTFNYCPTMNYTGDPFTIENLSGDCGTVSGDLFVDADDDCLQDAGEPAVRFALLSIQPGDELTFTNENGHYYHNLAYGAYGIEHPDPSFVQLCPAGSPVPFTIDGADLNVDIDMADSSLVAHDVSVNMMNSPARPGFIENVWIDLSNNSFYASGDLSLTYDYDPALQFVSSSLVPDATSSGQLQWDLPPLDVYGASHIHLQLQVPPDVGLIVYVLNSTATLTNTVMESNTANNSATSAVTITGSFDPNDKLLRTSSGASNSQYFMGLDEWLDYSIRFQNTGTDTAFTVVVRDTIALEFDLLTTEIIGSSHPMDVDVRNPRLLSFTFNDILLPDSTTNEAASHGYVSFRIRPVEGLLAGTPLNNDADIYFDFNPPVITNNTELVIDFSTQAHVMSPDRVSLRVFPNPVGHALRAVMDDPAHKVFSADVLAFDGRVVARVNTVLSGESISTHDLADGVYTLRLMDTDGVVHLARFVKH